MTWRDDHDLAREDAADRWHLIEEYAPAALEPAWLEPEGHESAEPMEPSCLTCRFGLSLDGSCYRCDWGCPTGCGPLDSECFCGLCGATTWPNQHVALHPELRAEEREAA